MRSLSTSWRPILLALLASLASGLSAQRLPACPEIVQSAGLKVVLDNVHTNGASGVAASPQDELFITRLRYMLDMRFRDPRLKAVMNSLHCNRYPTSKTIFDQGTLETLNDNNVVLELWGDVLPSQPGTQQAFINYLLVPVRFAEFGTSERGVYTVLHNVPSSPNADVLLHLFGEGKELPAFALVSLGVKQLRNHEFDAAKKNLAEGQFQLSRIFGRTSDADQKALLAYVQERTCDTVRQARADPVYSAKKGGLTYLSEAEVSKICAP